MSDAKSETAGKIGWIDLTVGDAEKVREFYGAVTGWKSEPVDMGGYRDFTMMQPASGEPVAGVCHARGTNAELPAAWIIYITVDDLDHSVERCTALGGKVRIAPKDMGSHGRYCLIEDPAGAVAALFEPASS